MPDAPQFKVHGKQRRELKKKVSLLKCEIRNFWHWWQVNDDMYSFCSSENPFPKKKARDYYNERVDKIAELEKILAVPYGA